SLTHQVNTADAWAILHQQLQLLNVEEVKDMKVREWREQYVVPHRAGESPDESDAVCCTLRRYMWRSPPDRIRVETHPKGEYHHLTVLSFNEVEKQVYEAQHAAVDAAMRRRANEKMADQRRMLPFDPSLAVNPHRGRATAANYSQEVRALLLRKLQLESAVHPQQELYGANSTSTI